LDQVSQRFPAWVQPYYPRVVGAGLAGAAAWFLVSCGCNCAASRGDRLFVGCVIVAVLLTATAFGIVHLFSSRYVTIALPFVVLMARPYFRVSWFACGRLATGAAIGFLSMLTYAFR
jgi:hypothetical protein